MKPFESRGEVVLLTPLRTMCCKPHEIPVGIEVKILHHMSPKMVMLCVPPYGTAKTGGYHKVKVSHLRTATGEKLEFLSVPNYAEAE